MGFGMWFASQSCGSQGGDKQSTVEGVNQDKRGGGDVPVNTEHSQLAGGTFLMGCIFVYSFPP